MSTPVEQLNIYQKISHIRKLVEALQKNKAGYGYKYVSEDEILAKVTAGLEKYHLDYYPSVVSGTTAVQPYFAKKLKYAKDGTFIGEDNINEVIVSAELNFTWINLDNIDERIVIPWVVVGQQSDASQAFGSGLTYCTRYFLLKFFKSSTMEDDPDAWRSKQQQAKDLDDAEVVGEIVAQIDGIVQENVNDTNRNDIQKLLKSFITKGGKPSADYRSIQSVEVATKVLEGLVKLFEKPKTKASSKTK